MPQARFTKIKLQILEALWARGKASIREILEALPETWPGCTTIQTTVVSRNIGKFPFIAITAALIGIGSLPTILAQQPAFDAASIKPNNPNGGAGRVVVGAGPSLRFTPGRVAGMRVTARRIILEAYHLREYQLSGGPEWLDADRFDIEGKADSPATEAQLRVMLQTLLTQRFSLSLRRESKEMPVYFLVVAKGGLKVPEWKQGEPQPPIKPRLESHTGGLLMDHVTMEDFAGGLDVANNPNIDRPVLDKTGLPGKYFFAVQWNTDEDFKTVVEDYFGLKFEPHKAPVDVFVIEHVEKPGAN